MRDVPANVLAALQSGEIRLFWLLHMEIGGSHYWYTNCDVSIWYGGNEYQSRSITHEAIEYSTAKIVTALEARIANADDALTSAFAGGDPKGDPIDLAAVLLDASYAIIDTPVTVFDGEIDSFDFDGAELVVGGANSLSRWTQRTFSRHPATCRWKKFKGGPCGYTGAETWCDRSYSRCQALGNVANFGGFRWLPSLQGKDIWWGRQGKVS